MKATSYRNSAMDRHRTAILVSKRTFLIVFVTMTMYQGVCTNKCQSSGTCGKCISEDPECAWCSQENSTSKDGYRCDYLSNLKTICNNDSLVSPVRSMEIETNNNLSDKGVLENEAIQIKPQEIRIRLRPREVTSFKMEFRQAVDYPVDLYYLMDLSNSMKDDKVKLAELGNLLSKEMKTITNNFRLGFGSFVDKTVAPFVDSHPEKLEQPCNACAAPYGYHNSMPLSSETQEFAAKVKGAAVSGNLDAPEGGFDALMQAIVCREEIGWRNKSRKLLVFSTDNAFHYAGDGRLGGIIAPNDERCHLDNRGYYTMSNELDYPSLSQIKRQIRDNKINMIFAVTKDFADLYRRVSSALGSSNTGELDADSSNIVKLIRQQYDKFTSSVEMTDDSGDPTIRINYFSKCLGETRENTNICRNLKVGKTVEYEVFLEYDSCPADIKQRNKTFHIYPMGLHDQLTIHLEMICECECEKEWKEEAFSSKCSAGNGTYECGICNCNHQRYGNECECDASETDPYLDLKVCIRPNDTRICSGNGECRCGRCDCDPRSNPQEKITGTYCECTNYGCDKKSGKLCSGPDHGKCICGECKCLQDWIGDDCSCRNTTATCIAPNGEICSGHGTCHCGSCNCSTEQDYFGNFCEDCSRCPGMCNELRDCVECFIESAKKPDKNCSICGAVDVLEVENIAVMENEKQCSFLDNNKCRFTFKYGFDKENQNNLNVWAKRHKECPEPIAILPIVAGVSGGVVAVGLLLLMLWKILTVIHDRRELAKFEKERLLAKWNEAQNPLYKEVETTYQNPAYAANAHSAIKQE